MATTDRIEADHWLMMTGIADTALCVGPADTWALPGDDIGGLLARQDVEGLASLLKDGDWQVRLKTVRALGVIGDARAIEHLIRALQDSDDRVSEEAGRVLRGISRVLTEQLR
jgi:HEAT repeat protein